MAEYFKSTFITVSRNAANRINKVFLDNNFNDTALLGHVDCDCDLGRIPIYKDMRVMITQNRNKQYSVVNGRVAHVVEMQGDTVFLRLKNGSIVQVYPVTQQYNDSTKTVAAFMPAYALTIPKAQGQTIDNCVVWLDSQIVAPGAGYVAFSRCKTLQNMRFMVAVRKEQVTPVPQMTH